MLSQRKSIISSDEDDDYELPSLSERVKAALTLQSEETHQAIYLSSDSEDEDSSFLKFSEKIQSTPCIPAKVSPKEIHKGAEDLKNFKNKKKTSPPPVNIKLDFTSESEDEEPQFLSFSQRIQSTPQVKVLNNLCLSSESDNDNEVFSNQRLNMLTSMTENKENYDTIAESGVTKKMSDFLTPLPPKKKVFDKAVDSDSDESFSNFVEILRTPMSVRKIAQRTVDSESDESFTSFVERLKTPLSVNRKIAQRKVDSESDESFTSFVERLKTPLSVNRKIQNKMIESDSDGSFLNNSRKQSFKTPKSQKKSLKDAVSLPKITEKNNCHSSLIVKDTPNSVKICSFEKEFEMLFQPESIGARFQDERKSYTNKLYEFYNRRVFNLRLPADMPLIYDGALKTTAGMTCCSVKNGIYTCLIKLSSSLIITFDRLKETLLHEMCHAAVWIVNKQHRVRHGPLWQVWASRCKQILPFIECPTRCHNYEISYRVWYQCPKCLWKKGRCKQVRKYHGALCGRCNTPIVVTFT